MQYLVTRGEKGKVEVKVDIPKVAFVAAYGDAIQAISKDSKFPGFRSGNVPESIIEDKIGVNKILNDTANYLVTKHLNDIFKKEKIILLGDPNIAVHSLVKESPFSFTATLTAKPAIKISDWKKIKVVKVKPKAVADKDVNESIKNIFDAWKKSQESKSEVESREGASGGQPSFVTSDAKAMEVKKASEGKKFIYDARGNKVFFDEKETLRSSSNQDSTAGLKISLGESLSKPDDEFARAIGARDLGNLQELVRKDLEKIVTDEAEVKLEQELFEEILKLCQVEVPDILVDDELNRIIVRITQNLEQQNKKLEDYLKEQNTTLDGFKAKMRPQAENNVKITLIMDEIGKKEKVQITKEEIENAAKGMDESKLSEQQKTDLRNYMAVSIFQSKTLELVKKTVVT